MVLIKYCFDIQIVIWHSYLSSH